MNTTRCAQSILKSPVVRWAGHGRLLLTAGLLLLSLVSGRAANQFWDAAAGTVGVHPEDGSGNWFTSVTGSTTNWWNGTADDSGTWSGTTPDNAFIGTGSGAAGIYTINLDAAVSANSITFTNPGSYTLTNNILTLTAGASNVIYVTTGVTATIATLIKQNGETILEASNAVLNLTGGSSGTWGGNPIFQGTNQNSSVLNIAGGLYLNGGGTMRFDSEVANITNATVSGPNRVDIGRNFAGTLDLWNNGRLIVDPTDNNNSGNNINISRGQPAIVNMYPGSLLSSGGNNAAPAGALFLSHDSASQATLNLNGGTVNVGNGSNGTPGVTFSTLQPITFEGSASVSYGATTFSIINMSGGIMTASAMQFGLGSAYTGNPTNRFNMTGGSLYLDVGNISLAKSVGTNFGINLSGGIIGATANWSPVCSVPMTLGTSNGNVTFQAADINGSSFNMAISGALTGPGGLTKTGGGNLTLSGANTFAGGIAVSNGTLVIVTSGSPTNGAVILDGTAGGTPNNSVSVANIGQHWSISSLTYAAGSPTADFNYGAFTPSTAVAPLLVNGNVAFTVTPNVTVEGTAIPAGVYPLIKYTGTLSGTPPSTVTLPGYASGYVTNLTASQTIALVVSASTYNPALSWRVGNGTWDNVTANWTQFGGPVDYTDGEAVVFDDTAAGPSPIAVTLNQTVNPSTVVVNSSADNYSIGGSGSIAGSASLTKDGSGTLTLSGTNTYSGGTTLNNGQLNLNYGGDGSANSAIGTGLFTINLGSKIDNTSGQAITLLTPVQQLWNDDFTFVGSTNLDLGTGNVTLGSGEVALTVVSNTLEVDGSISDNGGNYILTKAGAGTLTLSNYNSFSGGMKLTGGTLNVNQDGALGSGKITISSGVLDNTSGNNVALSEGNLMAWTGSFTFLGTTNLDLGGSTMSVGAITLAVSNNVLATEGTISGANNTMTKTGPGTLSLGGYYSNGGLGFIINQGTVLLNKSPGGNAFAGQLMTINTGGQLVMGSPTFSQLGTLVTITLSGGSLDLNGDSEPITTLVFNSGIFENSAPFTSSMLISSTSATLAGTNCDFDVTTNSVLEINAALGGTGTLVETDQGELELTSTNTYSGATMINSGTLFLQDPGEITNSVDIDVATGATLDATGRGDQTVTLGPVQTLNGGGGINGNLVAPPGSTVAPGTASAVGTLTVTNNITLGGNLLLSLNRTNAQNCSQLADIVGTITYGGTLSVTNLGPALQVGDVFHLFPAAVTAFSGINLATVDANGETYTWNNNVAVDGSISVASVTASVNPNPPSLQRSLSGSTLTLSWPTNAGWVLEAQTNSLSAGLGTNWVRMPGSSLVTTTNLTIDPANGSVFFRMVYP